MTTKTTAADLLNESHNLVKTLEPLFYNLVSSSQHHKLDTIQISTARAREITADLMILKNKLQTIKDSERIAKSATAHHLDKMLDAYRETAVVFPSESETDQHLDKMFGIN